MTSKGRGWISLKSGVSKNLRLFYITCKPTVINSISNFISNFIKKHFICNCVVKQAVLICLVLHRIDCLVEWFIIGRYIAFLDK